MVKKSNEEKAAEILAETIRDTFSLRNSSPDEVGQDENIVDALQGIRQELTLIRLAIERK